MPFEPAADARQLTYALERRQQRLQLPDCPACHVPLHVDVRSSDTLYARCQWCGHRRMLAKPAATE
jgi:DNA-directed RNA polymerase subunit RPC12/RpoP